MATEAARPPSPSIVTYGAWTNSSLHSIQPRYEALPNFVPKRTYAESEKSHFTHEVRRPKDDFSLGEVLVVDSCLRPKTAAVARKRSEKACEVASVPKKCELVRQSKSGLVEGQCAMMRRPATPRGQWLHTTLKPEAHYTGRRDVKQVALSSQARALKSLIAEPLKSERAPAAKAVLEESPPITQAAEYISTDDRDMVATINRALGLPPEGEAPEGAVETEELPAEEQVLTIDEQIQRLEAKAATLQKALRKTEYQAEFTFGNSLIGRQDMVTSLKPKHAQVEFFL